MSKMNRNQKAMLFAEGIVERYRARGNQLPHRSKTCRMDPNREQEYKDAAKLNDWKQSLKGNRGTCSSEIRNYLDLHIPSWRHSSRTVVQECSKDSDEENDVCQVKRQRLVRPTNIEAEVCYAMITNFSSEKEYPHNLKSSFQAQATALVQPYSPLSQWSQSDIHKRYDASSHNPNPLSCSEKRTGELMKHKRRKAEDVEVNEEVFKQLKLDSELLLHLMYSGRKGGYQSIRS